MDIEELAAETLNAAFAVHTALGPGLLESAYEACMIHELRKRGLQCESQVLQPIVYNGERIDAGYRLDILVEGVLIVELKAVDRLLPIHQAQTLTYLKLHGSTLGLLINFNVPHLKDGIQRMVLNHPSSPLHAPSSPSRLDTATGAGAEPQRTRGNAKEEG
jgi:GxxExxY protein